MQQEDLPPLNYRVSADYGKVIKMKSTNSDSIDFLGAPVNICTKINGDSPENEAVIGSDLYQMVKGFDDYKYKMINEFSIGLKTALKMIRQHSRLEDIPQIQEQLSQIEYEQIRKIFLEPEVADVAEIKFEDVDYEGITKYLVEERSFSLDRVNMSLNRLKKALEKKSQTLEQWMGD